jgi:hypothetical protein
VKPGLTPAEIRKLPAVVDLVTAGRALGLGRTKAYQLARSGNFPCRILHVGASYLVRTADLLTLLGLDLHGCAGCGSPKGRQERSDEHG